MMATPVVPSQFAVGKNRIIHKPTTATFSFETGHTTFKSINWGRADEQLPSGLDYRKDDIIPVAQQLLSKGKERHERACVAAWTDALFHPTKSSLAHHKCMSSK
jgi:hypothetical protein